MVLFVASENSWLFYDNGIFVWHLLEKRFLEKVWM